MERVLITGATGEVGSHVLAKLRGRGVRVVAASRDPDRAAARAASRDPDRAAARVAAGAVEWVHFDLEAPETFAPALEGVARVFLVARPGDDHADEPARPLIQAMRRAGVRHVVDLSAMGAERREDFALRRVERMLEESGLAWTHLRPNWFMQIFTGGSLLAQLRASGDLRIPAGPARLSFIDAADVAAVAAEALTCDRHAGRAFTLTGPEALDHAQVADAISLVAGRTVRYRALDEDEARRDLAAAGFGPARVERLIGFYRLVRAGWCAPVSPDVHDALGRPPRSFADFAREHAESWRGRGAGS